MVGEPRSTVDIDRAVQLDHEGLGRLIDAVEATFYLPTLLAAQAVDRHSSFNLVHKAESLKVNLFVLGGGILDVQQMQRRVRLQIQADPSISVWVTSAEDQVLRKLDWFRLGGKVSDRQWRDVVAILRIQHAKLDQDYLSANAALVGIDNLLERARTQAT